MTTATQTRGREIRAAVVRDKGGRFSAETLTLEGPRRDEVLVKIVATGMCHTDMVARDKVYDVPHPIVLGHEGAGIVESVGADARKVAPPDDRPGDRLGRRAEDPSRKERVTDVIRHYITVRVR